MVDVENRIKAAKFAMIDVISMLTGRGQTKAIKIGADIEQLLTDLQEGKVKEK